MELKYSGSGIVYFNEHEYRCDLYLNEAQGGILINISVKKVFADFLELPFHIDFLGGELSTGFKFSLISCSRQSMKDLVSEGRSVFTYGARYMFKGVGGKGCRGIRLYKMSFGLSGVMEWGSVAGYAVGEKDELLYNDDTEKEIYKNDKFTVKYSVSNSLLPIGDFDLLKEKIVLTQNGIIEITFKKEEAIDQFIGILKKIKRLIELSTLRRIHLNEITGWSSGIYDMYDQERCERPIEIIGCDLKKQEDFQDNSVSTWRWITLPELIKNNSFAYYFSKYELLEPVIELYLEVIYSNNISDIRVFLNVVQALETYHSRFKTNDIGEFKKRIEEVILKGRPKECIQKDTEFLMANSRKFITLESRMADLLLADFQTCFDTGDIKYLDFPNVIAKTRNYYIHYDEMIKENGTVLTAEELSVYNTALIYILEYYLLNELGFSDAEQIREKLNRRWRNISETLALMKLSKEKERISEKLYSEKNE